MHEINLASYRLRTDLAIDSKIDKNKDNYIRNDITKDIYVEEVIIKDKEEEKKYHRSVGIYKTICFKDITDTDNFEMVLNTFSKEFKDMLDKNNISDDMSVLIIGLGNIKSTPDALGPKSIDSILVTRHLFNLGEVEEGYRCVSVLVPVVTGETGIETKDTIFSIVKETKPQFVIIVDALSTLSIERLNKTIQISNSGIIPGSGVNNSRITLSEETLGVKTIVVGVPTIIDSSVIVADTIKYMLKKFSYDKNNINNKSNKLKYKINYKEYDKELNIKDKELLLGIVGTLNEEELMHLVVEVLSPIDYNFMVTPKEIDFIIEKLSLLIGKGLNKALHFKLRK